MSIDMLFEISELIIAIKLFAWEPYVLKERHERRIEELKMIRKGRILDLAMNMLNTQLPLVAKMTTLAIYVRRAP